MNRILKYRIPVDFMLFELDLHLGYHILHVEIQDGEPFIWIAVDQDQRKLKARFRTLATGQELNYKKDGFHVGTFQVGRFVYHVFHAPGLTQD